MNHLIIHIVTNIRINGLCLFIYLEISNCVGNLSLNTAVLALLFFLFLFQNVETFSPGGLTQPE